MSTCQANIIIHSEFDRPFSYQRYLSDIKQLCLALDNLSIQIFGAKFGLTPGQIGLQVIAQLVGAIIGEILVGRGSDVFMNWRAKKTGNRVPEHRLLLIYPGFVCSVVGLIGLSSLNITLCRCSVN